MMDTLKPLEKKILDRLVEHGYDAMIVGGGIRDYLIGRESNDIDIATNAPYEVLESLMSSLAEVKLVGSQFGVLLVGGIEVATYRSEVCKDNEVLELSKAPSAIEDSRRRDFTINSIYYDYKNNTTYDFHGGMFDIWAKRIRAVGSPYERFNEDYSRILRALYLSANLGFKVEKETEKAIRELGHLIVKIPNALKGKIVKKVIKEGCFYEFLKLLKEYELLEHLFPEMTHTIDLPQNSRYHKYAVWTHTLEVVKSAENKYKGNVAFVMGAFLHDIAKGLQGVRGVNRIGEWSDLGHEEAGFPIAKKICRRLELGKATMGEVAMYVKWHGVRMSTTEKSVKHFLFKFKDTSNNVEQLRSKFSMLLDFMECDADGFNDDFGNGIKQTLVSLREISERVFDKQVFYSNQFNFNASVIAQHPKVKPSEIRERIEFFIRNNIVEEEAVLKILDKQVD